MSGITVNFFVTKFPKLPSDYNLGFWRYTENCFSKNSKYLGGGGSDGTSGGGRWR